MSESRSVLAATQQELAAVLASGTRAQAVARWLYGGGELPRELPERLEGVHAEAWNRLRRQYRLPPRPEPSAACVSPDGTTKWQTPLDRGSIETVLIPGRDRSTVCVSSQVGCTRHCAFCATARLGFQRNLTVDEYLAQVYLAKAHAPPGAPLRNIVFMGMGEPMDNLETLLRAITILTQTPAPMLAPAHLTVSTSGVLPAMARFLRESRIHLALSLNATTDETRERLMPQNRLWPIAELMELLRAEATRDPGRLTFFEYVLFDGVNDTDEDAHRLVALLRGLPARVNLIPHNPFEESLFRPSAPERIRRFFAIVHAAGIRCLVRTPRGETIGAACGQLALRAPRG